MPAPQNVPQIAHADEVFVDGQWEKPSGTSRLEVVDPATEQVTYHITEAETDDIDRAVAAARRAFDHGPWPRMSHAERAGYLNAVADGIEKRAEDLGLIWTLEMGAAQSIVQPMLGSVPGLYRYYASLADEFPFEERRPPAAGGNVALLIREPVGTVAAILPWNGPIIMSAYKLAPALIAGCTVVLKAPPEAPAGLWVLAEIVEEAGLPPGVFNLVAAGREVSEHLVRHPGIDKVTFTGSTAAGKRIASICGERIARVTLELGGKSPAIVLDDYDVATVAESIAQTAPLNAGQVCHSLTRVIVSEHRHDDLVEALADQFSRIPVGDPFDPTVAMGPLAMARQLERVRGYITKGLEQGAVLATGGGRPAHLERGYFIEPTVFGRVDNSTAIARDEIFGPVVSVIPVRDEDEAVEVANDTDYGLNASVFSNDVERVYAIGRELRSGTVGHNYWRGDLSIAFGGFKESGIGREGGTEGLLPYLETKVMILDDEPAHLVDASVTSQRAGGTAAPNPFAGAVKSDESPRPNP